MIAAQTGACTHESAMSACPQTAAQKRTLHKVREGPIAEIARHARAVGRTTISSTSGGCSMAKAMARFCKATSMVPCCRGAEHAASRRGRIRIIVIPTVEEVVVAVSMEPRRCGRARKHGRGRKYQESKFPCHDRGSSALTSEETIDQSAACSKRRIRRMRGCALTFRANLARFSERVVRRVAMSALGHKATWAAHRAGSALPRGADLGRCVKRSVTRRRSLCSRPDPSGR
jgi:hypothetical protein